MGLVAPLNNLKNFKILYIKQQGAIWRSWGFNLLFTDKKMGIWRSRDKICRHLQIGVLIRNAGSCLTLS